MPITEHVTRIPEYQDVIVTHRPIPFDCFISDYFGLKARPSHVYDRQFLAWEAVRKAAGSGSEAGTGFEGYLVGIVTCPEQALTKILELGSGVWDSIQSRHPRAYDKKRQLEKTIRGEAPTWWAIREWSSIFGAVLGRQRVDILRRQDALNVRLQTKHLIDVSPNPQIEYTHQDNLIMQKYNVPRLIQDVPSAGLTNGLNDCQKLALLTMREIGKFGHPFCRWAINQQNI